MSSFDSFNNLLKNVVAPTLKKINYKKSGLTWYKDCNEFNCLINIQKSKTSDSKVVKFTINLGLFSPDLYEIMWEKKATSKMIKEENCLLRTRIGPVLQNNFTGNATDRWWIIDKTTSIEDLAVELLGVLENNAIPFLNKYKNKKDVLSFLHNLKGWQCQTPQHYLHLALLEYQSGHLEEAKEIITKIIKEYDPWRDRVVVAARNIGITKLS